MTQRRRPDFLILGAQKAGTNSLRAALNAHPDVWIHPGEPHYFDNMFASGAMAYQAMLLPGHKSRACGDCSPNYLLDPRAPARAFHHNPNMRLFALVRHPVDRAISHYYFMRRGGYESLSFEKAIDAEDIRLAGELERLRNDPYALSLAFVQHGFIARGLYMEQIERWLEVFPREQLMVLCTEELESDPASWVPRCYEFLGLEPRPFESGFPRKNVNQLRKEEHDRRPLLERFREPNEALFKYLGRRLDWDR